jgi:hypothetical protein
MPIPPRLVPKKASKQEVQELSALCDEIERGVVAREDVSPLLAKWNARACRAYEPTEFKTYYGAMSTEEFVRGALNSPVAMDSALTWDEVVAVFDAVMGGKLAAWELDFFRDWLEAQFADANISDLIFWPNEWFQNEEALQFEFTAEQFACAASRYSGRELPGAVEIELPFPLPPKKRVLLTTPP